MNIITFFSSKIVVLRQSANVIWLYVILSVFCLCACVCLLFRVRACVCLSLVACVYARKSTRVLRMMCMSYVSFLHIFEFTCTVIIMVRVEI